MHPLHLLPLLLSLSSALPQQQPPPNAQPIPAPNPLQTKILGRLSTPREWAREVPDALEAEGVKVPVGLTPPPVEEESEVVPTEFVVEKMNWDSTATDRFKDYLAVLKRKQKNGRGQEEMVPPEMAHGGAAGARGAAGRPGQGQQPGWGGDQGPRWGESPSGNAGPPNSRAPVNWGYKAKRSVIPKKFKKEEKAVEQPQPQQTETEAEDQQEQEAVDVEETTQVELTNEDFDEMFSYYANKHDTKGFQGLQGHLDSMMVRGQEDWRLKSWSPNGSAPPGTHSRYGRRSLGGSSPSYSPSSTPESLLSEKPAMSINPEVFNRIAADYRFDQNPTSINNEDSWSRNSGNSGSGSGSGGSSGSGQNHGHGHGGHGHGKGLRLGKRYISPEPEYTLSPFLQQNAQWGELPPRQPGAVRRAQEV